MPPQTTKPHVDTERGNLPSASGLDRVLNCPGSVAAERELPPMKEESYTTEGTDIHAALETGDPSKLSGDSLQICEKLLHLADEAVRIWHEENKLDETKTLVGKEERFWIHDRRTLNPLASAKLDRCYVNFAHAEEKPRGSGEWFQNGRGLIIDYKSGFLDAPPAYINAQLRTQAVALWHEYPELQHVRVAIAHSRFKTTFDFCDYALSDLQAAEQEIVTGLWKSAQPNASRAAGTWCRYCKAQANCREAAAYALLPVSMMPIQPPFKDVSVMVSQLSVSDLGKIHSRKAIAERIFKAVAERLKSLPADDLASIGYALKTNNPTRDFPDVKQLFQLLSEAKFATSDEFLSWCSVRIGDMEDSIVKSIATTNKITQKDAKGILASVIEPANQPQPRAPTLEVLK